MSNNKPQLLFKRNYRKINEKLFKPRIYKYPDDFIEISNNYKTISNNITLILEKCINIIYSSKFKPFKYDEILKQNIGNHTMGNILKILITKFDNIRLTKLTNQEALKSKMIKCLKNLKLKSEKDIKIQSKKLKHSRLTLDTLRDIYDVNPDLIDWKLIELQEEKVINRCDTLKILMNNYLNGDNDYMELIVELISNIRVDISNMDMALNELSEYIEDVNIEVKGKDCFVARRRSSRLSKRDSYNNNIPGESLCKRQDSEAKRVRIEIKY